MSPATASIPSARYDRHLPTEDSQDYSQPRIDLSATIGPYGRTNFQRRLTEWRAETYYQSSVAEKMDHPAFKRIVEIGERAVPWIIAELKVRPDFLFMALHLIKKFDPTPEAAKGKPQKLIEAWLQWAEHQNFGTE